MKKRVTIIIPSYNHASYIKDTISSIFNQEYKDFELIVIDDGSKDDSPELIRKLAIEYGFEPILKKNEGLCKTLNLGLEKARGEYIVFIASDDTFEGNRLQEQVDFLDAHPEIDVVAGGVNLIDNKGDYLFTKKPLLVGPISFEDIAQKNIIMAPTCMIRKSVYERFGKYREDYLYEDYYLWLKILKNGGKIFVVDKIWANYRYMSGNMSNRIEFYYKGIKQILSDYLPHPQIKKTLDRARLVYCVKSALFEGYNFLKQKNEEIKLLKIHYAFAVRMLAILPKQIRLSIYNKLIQRF